MPTSIDEQLPLPATLGRDAARGEVSYAAIDLADERALTEVFRRFKPTVVFHLAAALKDAAKGTISETNVVGTTNLFTALDAARLTPRVIVASSGGVYGRPQSLPLRENDACLPVDPYSASKLAGERIALAAAKRCAIDVRIARIFNVLGPGLSRRHAAARFAHEVALRVRTRSNAPVHVGTLTTTRDFIDVRDVAAALLTLARCGSGHHIHDVYNVASGAEASLQTIFELTCRAAHATVEPEIIPTLGRPADVQRHVGNVERLRSLGFSSRYSLREAVPVLVPV